VQDEAVWTERLRKGDPDALRWLYQTYREDLLRLAACLLGDLADVEDCLHDVMVAVAAMADRLTIRTSLKAYLVTSMVNRARTHRQRRQRATDAVEVPVDKADARSADGLKIAIRREEEQSVYEALVSLPYEQREAVIMHVQGEMTFQEIADHQGVSLSTAQSRFRYGVDRMRKTLDVRLRS
jgi:RNA polymerase sigma-70 factor (ECF subfamily)